MTAARLREIATFLAHVSDVERGSETTRCLQAATELQLLAGEMELAAYADAQRKVDAAWKLSEETHKILTTPPGPVCHACFNGEHDSGYSAAFVAVVKCLCHCHGTKIRPASGKRPASRMET